MPAVSHGLGRSLNRGAWRAGFRTGRGPMMEGSFIENAPVTGNSVDSNSVNIIGAGVGGVDMTHKGIVYLDQNYDTVLTISNGFTPTPILDESTNPTLVPVAFVTAAGHMVSPFIISGTSTKARVLQQIGVNMPANFQRAGSTDDPVTIYSPNVTLTDGLNGVTQYHGMQWDLNRGRTAGWTKDNLATGPTTVTVTDLAITNGSAIVTSASNPFGSADLGRVVNHASFPANTYVKTFNSAGSVTLTANATGSTASGQTCDFTGVDPRSQGFAYECQNATRILDVHNSLGYPVDRDQFATTLARLATAESSVWGATATKLPLLPMMVLYEEYIDFNDADPSTWPKHSYGFSLPLHPGTHIWPAQSNDPVGFKYDTSVLLQEGQRLRMKAGVNPPGGAPKIHQMIHRVAQTYGLTFWDVGNSVGFRCDPALAVILTGGVTVTNAMDNFKWDQCEALAEGSASNFNP